MQTLIDTTFTGKNIAAGTSVYEYAATAACTIRVQVRLAAVAGGGDYVAYLTLNDGDALTDDAIGPKTTYTAASGETAFWLTTGSLDVLSGDVINVMIDGLAADTSEAGSIRIFSDNYVALGSGAVSWTVTVNDGTNPLDGVEVWVTTDLAGANTVASGQTDTLGQVTFNLDAGTYYCWKQLSGYNFSNPETMAVA